MISFAVIGTACHIHFFHCLRRFDFTDGLALLRGSQKLAQSNAIDGQCLRRIAGAETGPSVLCGGGGPDRPPSVGGRHSTWAAAAGAVRGRPGGSAETAGQWSLAVEQESTWTDAGDRLLVQKAQELGSDWDSISRSFDGRTEDHIKNRWSTSLRRKSRQVEPARPRGVGPSRQSNG
jgi:hypothetical protein